MANATSPRGTTFTRHHRPGERSSRPSFLPHLPSTSPTLFLRAFPHTGVTDTHIPYQKLRLLLRLPAPVRTLGSRALAGRRRRAPDTLSRRDAPDWSPTGPRSRRRHLRGGRSRTLLHFRPPVSSEDSPQRRGALEAHRKYSHPRRPEMTSRGPTGPALRPPSSAQPREQAGAALEHARTEQSW